MIFILFFYFIFQLFSLAPQSQVSSIFSSFSPVKFNLEVSALENSVQDISLAEFGAYLAHNGAEDKVSDLSVVSHFRHLYHSLAFNQQYARYERIAVEHVDNAIDQVWGMQQRVQVQYDSGEFKVINPSEGISLSAIQYLFLPYLSSASGSTFGRRGQGLQLTFNFLHKEGDSWEFSFYEPHLKKRCHFTFYVRGRALVHGHDRLSLDHIRVRFSMSEDIDDKQTISHLRSSLLDQARLSSHLDQKSLYQRYTELLKNYYQYSSLSDGFPSLSILDGSHPVEILKSDKLQPEVLSCGEIDGEKWQLLQIRKQGPLNFPKVKVLQCGRLIKEYFISSVSWKGRIDYVIELPASVVLNLNKKDICWNSPSTLLFVQHLLENFGKKSFQLSSRQGLRKQSWLHIIHFFSDRFKSGSVDNFELKSAVYSSLFRLIYFVNEQEGKVSMCDQEELNELIIPPSLIQLSHSTSRSKPFGDVFETPKSDKPFDWMYYFFQITFNMDFRYRNDFSSFKKFYDGLFLGLPEFMTDYLQKEGALTLLRESFFFDLISRLRVALSLENQKNRNSDKVWGSQNLGYCLYRILSILYSQSRQVTKNSLEEQLIIGLIQFFEKKLVQKESQYSAKTTLQAYQLRGYIKSHTVSMPLVENKNVLSDLEQFRQNAHPLVELDQISFLFGQSQILENCLFHLNLDRPSLSRSFGEIITNAVEAGSTSINISSYQLASEDRLPTGKVVFEIKDNGGGIKNSSDVLIPFSSTKSDFATFNFGWGFFISVREGDEIVIHSKSSSGEFKVYLTRRKGQIYYDVIHANDFKGALGTCVYLVCEQDRLNMDGQYLRQDICSKLPLAPVSMWTHQPVEIKWEDQDGLYAPQYTVVDKNDVGLKNHLFIPLHFSFDLFSDMPSIVAKKDQIISHLTHEKLLFQGYIIEEVSAQYLADTIGLFVDLDDVTQYVVKLRLREYLSTQIKFLEGFNPMISKGGISRGGIVSNRLRGDMYAPKYQVPIFKDDYSTGDWNFLTRQNEKESCLKSAEHRFVLYDYPSHTVKSLEDSDAIVQEGCLSFPVGLPVRLMHLLENQRYYEKKGSHVLGKFEARLKEQTNCEFKSLSDEEQDQLAEQLSAFFVDENCTQVFPSIFNSSHWHLVERWERLPIEEQVKVYKKLTSLLEVYQKGLNSLYSRQLVVPEDMTDTTKYTEWTIRGRLASGVRRHIREVFEYGEYHLIEFLKKIDEHRDYLTPELWEELKVMLFTFLKNEVYLPKDNKSYQDLWKGVDQASSSMRDSYKNNVEGMISESLERAIPFFWRYLDFFKTERNEGQKVTINLLDHMNQSIQMSNNINRVTLYEKSSFSTLWNRFCEQSFNQWIQNLPKEKYEQETRPYKDMVNKIIRKYSVQDVFFEEPSFHSKNRKQELAFKEKGGHKMLTTEFPSVQLSGESSLPKQFQRNGFISGFKEEDFVLSQEETPKQASTQVSLVGMVKPFDELPPKNHQLGLLSSFKEPSPSNSLSWHRTDSSLGLLPCVPQNPLEEPINLSDLSSVPPYLVDTDISSFPSQGGSQEDESLKKGEVKKIQERQRLKPKSRTSKPQQKPIIVEQNSLDQKQPFVKPSVSLPQAKKVVVNKTTSRTLPVRSTLFTKTLRFNLLQSA